MTAFYKDEWDRLTESAERLSALGQRWQRQPPPPGAKAPTFQKAAGGFSAAADELLASSKAKQETETTRALRRLARHLADLEKIK